MVQKLPFYFRVLIGFCVLGCHFSHAQTLPTLEMPADQSQPDLPQSVRTAMKEGNAAFAKKDYQRARGAYEIARKVVPDNLLVLVNLGLTEFYLKNSAEAEKFLFRAIQQKIELPAAWLVLGLIYLDANHYEKAMAAFAQVVLYEPRNARAHNYLGVAIGQMGWFDGAESEFRRAVELDASYTDAHFNLAYFALQRRQPAIELARRHYRKAIELGAARDYDLEKELKTSGTP